MSLKNTQTLLFCYYFQQIASTIGSLNMFVRQIWFQTACLFQLPTEIIKVDKKENPLSYTFLVSWDTWISPPRVRLKAAHRQMIFRYFPANKLEQETNEISPEQGTTLIWKTAKNQYIFSNSIFQLFFSVNNLV